MPETRKFAQGLKRKGAASSRRESSSLQIRSSVYSDIDLVKSSLSDPVDYESFISKRQSEIKHDSLSDLLLFPSDDVIASAKPRELRTVADTVPRESLNEASSLMVQECVRNYSSSWHTIDKKYEEYGQNYLSLPKNEAEENVSNLPEQVFELDDEPSVEEDVTNLPKEGITKQGWLYKAPDYGVANLSVKSFKRRYCHLKQLPDSSYILNYYKDEKISKDPKGAIYLDSCLGAQATPKGRKHAFEIRMQDQNCHILAAETEPDTNEWIASINLALQNTMEAQALQKEKFEQEAKSNSNSNGELGSLKSSMHPELIKYAKETDQKNAQERKRGRRKLFNICPDFQNRFSKDPKTKKQLRITPPPSLGACKHRIMVNCKSISFNLRGVVKDGADEPVTNVEPFFVSLALYDVTIQKKISADLHVDLNHELVRKMIPTRSPSRGKRPSSTPDDCQYGEPSSRLVDTQWVAHPKRGIFTVSKPNTDIYLVVRIEKVLQGSIKQSAPPYMRSDSDNHKAAAKVLKHAKAACQRLGQYRMPFAWTAKQLFLNDKGHLNTNGFDLIYKQESSKLAEEDLLKFLSDFKRQEKLSKLEFIDCELKVEVDSVPTDLPNILTSSLVPVLPFDPSESEPTLEVDELLSNWPEKQHINMEYTNHCYVYPKALNYVNQKSFTKARNIAVVAEFRDSDTEGASPLCVFYKKPGPPGTGVFTTKGFAAILHHQEKPEFYEEWKISLPTQLHHGHHILFTFYHVVVDITAKKKDTSHMEVGQAWLPLLSRDGRVCTGEHNLPVAVSLPPGYLAMVDQIGKHNQDIKWVDGCKPLFRVGLSLVSSVYTDDQHIHNFFEACKRFHSGSSSSTNDIIKYLKSLLACETGPLVRFLPTILKQLLYLFTADGINNDVQSYSLKTLVNIVATCFANGHEKLLNQYIKFMFITAPWKDYQSKTIHEELATTMTAMLRPTTSDFLTTNKLMMHFSFFLQIIVKSVVQHLISTQKIKLERTERFPVSFRHAVQSLVTSAVPRIISKWKTNYTEVHNANQSLAVFVRDCFTYLDRGFVFKLINIYCTHFNPGDAKVLFEMKFEFLREVCNHEHYIPLNLPFACSAKGNKNTYSYSLTDEYCRYHFLAGILMKNLCTAMYEPQEIREIAIETFRNLIAKHAFDDRYKSSPQQSRIASLYLPFLRIMLDNVARFSDEPDVVREAQNHVSECVDSGSTPVRGGGDTVSIPSAISERGGSLRSSRIPDSSLMSTIANPGSTLLNRAAVGVADTSSINSSPAVSTQKLAERNIDPSKEPTLSIASMTRFVGTEQFDPLEIRNLLLCFLYVVNNLPNDGLLGFWKDSTTDELIDFFEVLMLCLHHFRYTGKKQSFQGIRFGSLSKINGNISRSFPARIRSSTAHLYNHVSKLAEPMVSQASHMVDEQELEDTARLEANLSTEVGKIALDMLAEFTRHYKKQLGNHDGDNPLMQKFFDALLRFLQVGQSEDVLRHVFASLRLFLCKFPNVLFRGSADLCASLIYHALKCCNSSLASTRSEACALLYLLMRNNYESVPGRNFVRSHLQMIKAVSQLISKETSIASSRFQHSLSVINTYAISDKGMQSTRFPNEVKDLTKKIRTVLMATAAMKEHSDDPEKLIDLQCSLAKSYAATPELRKTWLEEMARAHTSNKNHSEAAMCYIHIAALVAEYLKRKALSQQQPDSEMYAGLSSSFVSKLLGGGRSPPPVQHDESGPGKGCAAFRGISLNVEREESSIKEDAGMQDVHYSENILIELLHTCADLLQTAERYELLAPVFNMIIPYYEKRRDYEALISIYSRLKTGYEKVVEVNRNGKRMLGTYFRVGFYGQSLFEDEDGKEYIYKEPKLTQLNEISHRLQAMYGRKLGAENIRLIQESGKVNRKDLDPKLAYIQVTYVLPYFDDHEREQRRNYFEQQQNVKNFVFETPFTLAGRARGDIEDQWKRKTILTTSHYFPYIKKRISVVAVRSYEMKPIEVALDEMTLKCNELEQLISAERIDLKKMQLRLQGSVNVQVNAGPLAYARAFLLDNKIGKHAANTVEMLRKIYRRFIDLCGKALSINKQLINTNQQAYHNSLHQCYVTMAGELSQILHEQLLDNDDDAISVTTGGFEPEVPVISPTPKRVAGSVSDASVV